MPNGAHLKEGKARVHSEHHNGTDQDKQRVGAFGQGLCCTRDVHGLITPGQYPLPITKGGCCE